ncbi:MAG: alpha/beta fold hydrolase [Myxococcota bacterium]
MAGQAFYTKAQRLADGEAPHPTVARPQTPAPPYPYDQREVVIDAPEGGKLAGTLTLPKGAGPFPAVLLISGSGQQDRDETIFGHRPFRLIADRLTRAGLAVLRVDDRATGKSQGALGSLETDIGDARAAFELLLAQPEIDPKRVGLLGHSIGGAIAPIVAARTKKVAFIVSLAGTAMPGSELVQLQMQADLSARGAPPEVIAKVMDIQKKIGAVMLKGDPAELRTAAAEAIRGTYELNGQPAPSGPDLDKAVDAKMVEVTNPWTLGYFRTDPREAWREVTVPVLVLMGAKDTQVPPASQLPAVVAALKEAKNADVTAREVPGLNHLFQHADKGIPEEYGMIEETFDPQTLEDIATWLRARTHLE